MKKFFAIVLAAAMLAASAGCAQGFTDKGAGASSALTLSRPEIESVYGSESPLPEATAAQAEQAEPSQAVQEQAPQGPADEPQQMAAGQETPAEQAQAAAGSGEEQASAMPAKKTAQKANKEMKGVWISYLTLDGLAKNKTEAQFTANMDTAFQNAADLGMNTIFAQVRPFGDALYQSEYFPWSYVLTGAEGQDPGYDPLAIMCKLADKHDLRIEAWINPYRVRTAGSPHALASDNPANKLLKSGGAIEWNGGIYYNPGSAQARKLIIKGVKEIVANYDVDGIHFDDYFYPTTDMAFDKATYAASGSSLSQADWRRENVNILVREVYAAIKAINADCVFGISPQGNTDNNYDGQFIDCAKWLANTGYVDYICPQIYFGFQNSSHPYASTVEKWNNMIKVSGIDLYVGIAAYKLGQSDNWAGSGKNEWLDTTDILARMVQTAREAEHYGGVAIYSYESLFLAQGEQVRVEQQNLKDIF